MISQIAFNRPSDTIAYSALDSLNSTGSTEPFFVPVSNNDKTKRVILKNIIIKTSMTSVPTGLTYIRFLLFSSLPSVTFADNTGIGSMLSTVDSFLGYFDSPNLGAIWGFTSIWKNGIENVYDISENKPNGINTPGIYVGLQTGGAFTPVSGTRFVINFGFIGVE